MRGFWADLAATLVACAIVFVLLGAAVLYGAWSTDDLRNPFSTEEVSR